MKIAVFYYTQTGQAYNVARSICAPFTENDSQHNQVVYKKIEPMHTYPFPWSRTEFFSVFAETYLGIILSEINKIDFSDIEDADIVIIVGQSWYLSPSLPLQSFFADDNVKNYLKGRKVVFVNVCRNMWLMTSRKIKTYMKSIGALFVGHIVLQDRHQNLVSVVTIVRWLIKGKKEATRLFPQSGVSEKDINEASRFGDIILSEWEKDHSLSHLQERLLDSGAIEYNPSVLFLEKAGHRIFGIWANIIINKGNMGNIKRRFYESLLYYYLLFALFVVSPFVQLLFYLTYPIHRVSKNKGKDCRIDI